MVNFVVWFVILLGQGINLYVMKKYVKINILWGNDYDIKINWHWIIKIELQKLASIFFVDVQCQQFGHLIA